MAYKEFIAALVVDSHPGLPNIRDAWKQAKEIVGLDLIAKNWCEAGSRKIVTAFRRGIHMSEELRAVKDKVVSNNDVTYKKGYTGCYKCLLCTYSKFDSWVVDFTTGYRYPINGSYNCNTKNAIYYIWVDHNEKSYPYIGRSTNPKVDLAHIKTNLVISTQSQIRGVVSLISYIEVVVAG